MEAGDQRCDTTVPLSWLVDGQVRGGRATHSALQLHVPQYRHLSHVTQVHSHCERSISTCRDRPRCCLAIAPACCILFFTVCGTGSCTAAWLFASHCYKCRMTVLPGARVPKPRCMLVCILDCFYGGLMFSSECHCQDGSCKLGFHTLADVAHGLKSEKVIEPHWRPQGSLPCPAARCPAALCLDSFANETTPC